MRKINLIVIHCSDTYARMDIGVNEIRQWHPVSYTHLTLPTILRV